MTLLVIFGLLAVLWICAACARAVDVFKQLEAESKAREAALYGYAFDLTGNRDALAHACRAYADADA